MRQGRSAAVDRVRDLRQRLGGDRGDHPGGTGRDQRPLFDYCHAAVAEAGDSGPGPVRGRGNHRPGQPDGGGQHQNVYGAVRGLSLEPGGEILRGRLPVQKAGGGQPGDHQSKPDLPRPGADHPGGGRSARRPGGQRQRRAGRPPELDRQRVDLVGEGGLWQIHFPIVFL